MAKAVGIDIGSRAVKLAVVDGGPKGARLVRFVERPYETEGAPTQAQILDTLKKALAAAKAPRNAASFAMPAERCVLREVSVPFTQEDQINKVVKFEFEPHLHSAAIEDVIVDFVITGPARTGTRLLVMACEKPTLARLLEELKQGGVDPLHVDIDVAALWNVATASGATEAHPNCLILDVGARTTKTLLVQNGRLKVARSIRIGAESAKKRLTTDFEGDTDAAAKALENAAGIEALAAPAESAGTLDIVLSVGAVETAVAKSRADQFLRRVMRETQRTLPMLDDESAITRIFVTGGGIAQHPNARRDLEERFGVPVEDLPIHEAASQDLAPSELDDLRRSGAVALGTALKVLGMDVADVDLRQDEFRFARTFDQLKNVLAFGVTLAFFAVFLLFLSTFMKKQRLDSQLRKLVGVTNENLEADVFEAYRENVSDARSLRLANEETKYFQTADSSLDKIENHLKNELGLGTSVPPIISCLEMQQAVMSSIKAARGDVEFLAIKTEDYAQEKVTVTVVVGQLPDITAIVTALRKHTPEQGGSLFESVDNQPPRPTNSQRYEVGLRIVVLPRELEPGAETSSAPTDDTTEVDTASGEER